MTPDDLKQCFPGLEETSSEDLAYLLDAADYDEISKGTRLIRSGQTSDCVYMICSGSARITLVNDKECLVLGNFGEGQWVGEMGMIEPAIAVAEVTTTTDCEVLVISHAAFMESRKKRPTLTSTLLHLFSGDLAGRLRTTIEYIDRKSESNEESIHRWYAEIGKRLFGVAARIGA